MVEKVKGKEIQLAPVGGTDIAVEIGRLYQRGIEDWIECGRLLKIQRDALDHGQWLSWLEKNRERLGFGERAAQRLLQLQANPQLAADLWWHEKRRDGKTDKAKRAPYLETPDYEEDESTDYRRAVTVHVGTAIEMAELIKPILGKPGVLTNKIRADIIQAAKLWGELAVEVAPKPAPNFAPVEPELAEAVTKAPPDAWMRDAERREKTRRTNRSMKYRSQQR